MMSPTLGKIDIPGIADVILKKVQSEPGEYNVVVGTDSQNFDKTKVVVVIAMHHVGHGGIFFYDITYVRRIDQVGPKLLFETNLSLQYAMHLIQALDNLKEETGFDYEKHMSFSIHVDAGEMGDSKQVIPEIVGWITACGYKAVIKPDSFAACSIANKYSK